MKYEQLGQLLSIFVFGTMFCFIFYSYLRDVFFYWKNGWDWSKEPEFNNMYSGEIEHESTKIRGKYRVFLGFPVALVVVGYFMYQLVLGN